MDHVAPVHVSHHQFQVLAGSETGDHLPLYTAGDDLLQITGRGQVTVLTGPHTGRVQVRLTPLPGPPDGGLGGWDAASEATLWSPTGTVAVCGLMGDCPDPLTAFAGAGLLRVRVLARDRRPDARPPDPAAPPPSPERYQIQVWPVDEETGFRTLRTDELPGATWTPDSAGAAGWAMLRLLTLANPPATELALRHAAGRPDPAEPGGRVRLRRRSAMPLAQARAVLRRPAAHLGATVDGAELVLPAGEVEVRLRPLAAAGRFAAQWRWAARPGVAVTVPDQAASTFTVCAEPGSTGDPPTLVLTHDGVRTGDAVLLGLIADHLLDHCRDVATGGRPPPHPWLPVLADLRRERAARAEAARHTRAARESRRWGGAPPSERLRTLPANTIGLARLDRRLLDALAHATPAGQRAVARWAAAEAYAVAGLDRIDWIAPALAALERGRDLPAPFDDEQRAWQRLRTDPRVPATTVTGPTGTPNCSQQAMAFPALRAATHPDPLAAAVEAVYCAVIAHGDRHHRLLAAAAARLAQVT